MKTALDAVLVNVKLSVWYYKMYHSVSFQMLLAQLADLINEAGQMLSVC